MADVTPNYDLSRKQAAFEIASLQLNMQSQELRIAQIEDEKVRLTNNIEATHTAIKEKQKELDALPAESKA